MSNVKGSIPERKQKYCENCGEPFLGGALSKYCYECKYLKSKESNKKYIEKEKI